MEKVKEKGKIEAADNRSNYEAGLKIREKC